MIRATRHSKQAFEVAKKALAQFVPDHLTGAQVAPLRFEIGVVPTFRLSIDDASSGNWNAAKRVGWRFICLARAEDATIGTIVDVSRSRWRKPRFSRFSTGGRAHRHAEVMTEAMKIAEISDLDCHVRVVRMPVHSLEFVWLKPVNHRIEPVFLPLSTRRLEPEDVAKFLQLSSNELKDTQKDRPTEQFGSAPIGKPSQ